MKNVEFESDGELVRGFFCEPGASGRHPAIVLIHGLLSSHEEFGDYPSRFADRGYVTLAIDLRGHGASQGMRGFITEERMVRDVECALDFVVAQPGVDKSRIALFGHSFGGGASICTAARDPRVAAVVAGATVGRLREEVGPGEYRLYRSADLVNRLQKKITHRSLYIPYRVKYKDIFADPQAAARARDKGFLQGQLPVDNIPPLLMQDAIACARHVHIPVLMLIGELDQVVKRSSPQKVYDALAGEKEWYIIESSGHSFATDCRRDVAFDKIAGWLDGHLS